MTTLANKAGIATCMTLLFATPAMAHHSFGAAYDLKDPITVTGVITDVRLTNPHSYFFLDVKDANGKIEHWKFEAGTPGGMIRNGFSRDLVKKGNTVTIKGFHARDKSASSGMLSELVTADGTSYGMFGPQQNPGAK